jgi:2'-phosphotransferase
MRKRGDRKIGGANDTDISKTLSWVLRHGAVQEGLTIEPSGYVPLEEVIQLLRRKGCKNVD